jgi:MFS family permease
MLLRSESSPRNIADSSYSGAFSGLLAYCISLMDGVGGYGGWQWIFILEGAATIVGGLVAWFFIHDSPNGVKWLDEDEAAFVTAQLAYDGNSTGNAMQEGQKKSVYIKEAFCDWQVCSNLSASHIDILPLRY